MGVLKKVGGQEKAAELLGRAYSTGRLAHAYLFAGPGGVGRLTAALELAASIMCDEAEDGYCGTCRNCSRIFSFGHPDVRLTIPVKGSTGPAELSALFEARIRDGVTPLRLDGNTRITIEQVRNIGARLSVKAFENHGHVEIILDADRMGVEAANALLKTLEEPPEETLMILVSSRWSSLLPTIRSRTHLVRFRRVDDDLVKNILVERLGMSPEDASAAAMISDGRPGLALLNASRGGYGEVECDHVAVIGDLVKCASPFSALSLASKTASVLGREGGLELCRMVQALLHDVRRLSAGLRPIAHSPEGIGKLGISEDACRESIGVFALAEKMLAGNGRPEIVLGAAFTGMWKVVHESG